MANLRIPPRELLYTVRLIVFLKYCASWFWLDVLRGFFLTSERILQSSRVFQVFLVLPYFYECNRWLHRFLPHTDCSREHLTVQHLKRTPHPGLTGRWNSSVSCSVNFELLKTVDCVWCQFLVNAIVLLNLLNESLKSLLKLRIECTILKFTVTGPRGNIKKGGKNPHRYPKTYESDCIKLAEFWLP